MEVVPEAALDYEEIFHRGGANLGDEDFALFKCPNCGQVYLLEYEVDTVYLNPLDLADREPVFGKSFDCRRCRIRVPDDSPWIGRRQDSRFAVTWAELAASDWKWITEKTRSAANTGQPQSPTSSDQPSADG